MAPSKALCIPRRHIYACTRRGGVEREILWTLRHTRQMVLRFSCVQGKFMKTFALHCVTNVGEISKLLCNRIKLGFVAVQNY